MGNDQIWRTRYDSNVRPLPPEGNALSTELRVPLRKNENSLVFNSTAVVYQRFLYLPTWSFSWKSRTFIFANSSWIYVFARMTGWSVLFFFSSLAAFVSDGTHREEAYEMLAKKEKEFNAVCLVECKNGTSGFQQTGVLISPNIVITAGHGLKPLLKNVKGKKPLFYTSKIQVTFKTDNNKLIKGYSDAVFIEPRYLEKRIGSERKHDIAFIRLENSIKEIQPVSLRTSFDLPVYPCLTVVTFSNFDSLTHSFYSPVKKRAFHLFEIDEFVSSSADDEEFSVEKSVLFSSIFFKPSNAHYPPPPHADEVTIRAYNATQSWRYYKCGPYGLGLPGTSGAPVFIRERKKSNDTYTTELLGIVTSYSSITSQTTKSPETLLSRATSQNHYQTIFALFFREKRESLFDREKKNYILDEKIISRIKTLETFPALKKSKMELFIKNSKKKLKNLYRHSLGKFDEILSKLGIF